MPTTAPDGSGFPRGRFAGIAWYIETMSLTPVTAMPSRSPTGDIPLDEFRRHADTLVHWIAEYLGSPERYPVLSPVAPGDIRASLPPAAPDAAEPLSAIIADLDRIVMPGVTHWNHPGFLAYFANTASVPGILGEIGRAHV